MSFEVVVLGSAQDGGLPQLGAMHLHDRRASRGDLAGRSASSLAICTDRATLLLDASPDIRSQARLLADRPPIETVALTHGHMGHYTGLIHFGKEAWAAPGVHLAATGRMIEFLTANQPWRSLLDGGHLVPAGFDHRTRDGVTVEAIAVPHRAEHTDTVALSVDGRLLYLPDIDSWDAWPEAADVIARHEIAFLDATFWSSDELTGSRTVGEVPHPPVVDTISRFATLADRIVLTHLNHTNPLVDEASPESRRVRSLGFRIAQDGYALAVR